MGNIFCVLLTKILPFERMETEKAVKLVNNGEQPPINDRIKSSKHPVDQGLRQAIQMCFIHDPKERPSARMVSDFLTDLTGVLAIDTENVQCGTLVGATGSDSL